MSESTPSRLVPAVVICLGLFLFAYTVPLANVAKNEIAASLGLVDAEEKPIPEDTWPLFTSYFLAWLIIVPPSGFLADRIGRKALLLAGSLTLTAGMILLSFATDLTTACIAQFLSGAGAIILQIVGVAAITDLYAESRGSVLSLVVGMVGMIALLSPVLMGSLLTQGVAWQSVYRFSAVLPVIAFVCQLACRFPQAAGAAAVSLRDVGQLLASPLFLLLIIAMLVYAIVEQGIPIWAPSFLEAELGVSKFWQGMVVSGYFLVMSLVRTVIGGWKLFSGVSHAAMIATSAALGAICLALGVWTSNEWMAGIFLAVVGGAIAQIWPSIMTFAVEATEKPTTTVFGLIVGLGGATGVILGSGLLGRIRQAGFTYQQSLLTLEVPLVVLVVVFGLVALLRRGQVVASAEA